MSWWTGEIRDILAQRHQRRLGVFTVAAFIIVAGGVVMEVVERLRKRAHRRPLTPHPACARARPDHGDGGEKIQKEKEENGPERSARRGRHAVPFPQGQPGALLRGFSFRKMILRVPEPEDHEKCSSPEYTGCPPQDPDRDPFGAAGAFPAGGAGPVTARRPRGAVHSLQ